MSRPSRRNGKQQACEPCRISKLRCDHGSPVCARCIRRDLRSSCFYHPSPMTRRVNASRAPKSPQPTTRQQAAASTKEAAKIAEVTQTYDDDYGIFFSNIERPSKVYAGFLGPTSYSAIFSEHQSNFGIESDDWSQELSSDAFQDPEMPEQSSQSRKASFINLGMRALKQLPDQRMCDFLLARFFICNDFLSLHRPTVRHAHASFWSTYGGCLQEPRIAEKLREVSREMCQNSRTILTASRTATPQEWWASFTGHQYRWEIVSFYVFTITFLVLFLWSTTLGGG